MAKYLDNTGLAYFWEKIKSRKRTFILLGDSFEFGIDGDNTSQRVTGGGWGERCKDILESLGHTVYIQDYMTLVAGAVGFATSRTFLSLLQDMESHYSIEGNSVTDIVVLGGTNDIWGIEDGSTASDVDTAVATFCTYCRQHFPNAKLKIGALSTRSYDMLEFIEPHYSKVREYGGEYIGDLTCLMVDYNYFGSDGLHLTQNGYAYYSPYICDAILDGHCYYHLTGSMPVTINTTNFENVSGLNLNYVATNSGIAIWFDSSVDTIGFQYKTIPSVYGAKLVLGTIPSIAPILRSWYKFGEGMVYGRNSTYASLLPRNAAYLYVHKYDKTIYLCTQSGQFTSVSGDLAHIYYPRRSMEFFMV